MKPIISIYAGHDSSISIYHPQRNKYYHLQLDRLFAFKHFAAMVRWSPLSAHPNAALQNQYDTSNRNRKLGLRCEDFFSRINKTIYDQFGIENDYSWFIWKDKFNSKKPDAMSWLKSHPASFKFENFHVAGEYRNNQNMTNHSKRRFLSHHDCHAYSGFIQSPFKKAICFTNDGGGDDTKTQIVYLDENLQMLRKTKYPWQMGWVYGNMGASRCKTFSKTTGDWMDLSGKMMGLCAYGKPSPNVIEKIDKILSTGNFYLTEAKTKEKDKYVNPIQHKELNQGDWDEDLRAVRNWKLISTKRWIASLWKQPYNALLGAAEMKEKGWKEWGYLEGQEELDCALATQMALEKYLFLAVRDVIIPNIKNFDNNLVLSGGTHMNVLATEMLRRAFPDVNIYVPPDPGDDGLSKGILLGWMAENGLYKKEEAIKFETPKLLDYDSVPAYVKKRNASKTNLENVAALIRQGKIIGLLQGNIEQGPRALGFRSIICNPEIPEMKDIINSKVKFREWFRPFAPACVEEDVEEYFYSPKFDELFHTMSSVADVKEKWKSKIPSVTHIDNTARLQTVTEKSNPLFYRLLKVYGGVLLNTSFNVQGQPILNTLKSGLEVLDKTKLDYVVVEHEGNLWIFE